MLVATQTQPLRPPLSSGAVPALAVEPGAKPCRECGKRPSVRPRLGLCEVCAKKHDRARIAAGNRAHYARKLSGDMTSYCKCGKEREWRKKLCSDCYAQRRLKRIEYSRSYRAQMAQARGPVKYKRCDKGTPQNVQAWPPIAVSVAQLEEDYPHLRDVKF